MRTWEPRSLPFLLSYLFFFFFVFAPSFPSGLSGALKVFNLSTSQETDMTGSGGGGRISTEHTVSEMSDFDTIEVLFH